MDSSCGDARLVYGIAVPCVSGQHKIPHSGAGNLSNLGSCDAVQYRSHAGGTDVVWIYQSFFAIYVAIPPRILVGIVTAVVYAVLLPRILDALHQRNIIRR